MQFKAQSLAILLLVFTSPFFAQSCSSSAEPAASTKTAPPSLAELARENKSKKVKAKAIVTDDDLDPIRGPLPSLEMEGMDNSDDVVRAIIEFSHKHKPEETEDVVRDWYERYDSMLETAIRENVETRDLVESNNFNGYTICQQKMDYQSCVARRQMEMRSARQDGFSLQKNSQIIMRIQQAFMRIRSSLPGLGIKSDWFKIRNADNSGSY